jgi:hypothetical protein
MFACGSLLVWITCKYPFFGLVILFFWKVDRGSDVSKS